MIVEPINLSCPVDSMIFLDVRLSMEKHDIFAPVLILVELVLTHSNLSNGVREIIGP